MIGPNSSTQCQNKSKHSISFDNIATLLPSFRSGPLVYNISHDKTYHSFFFRQAKHCALGAILDLLHNSKTSGSKIMKFTPSPTFTMRNILVKNFWPLKARKAMLK